MNQKCVFFATLLIGARAAPASSCSQTADVNEPTSLSSAEGCLLAQRTHFAVVESLGESDTFRSTHLATHRMGQRMSMTVDSSADLSSRTAAWLAYQSRLPEALAELETSRVSANGQLEELIDKFIAKQAGSADATSAKLVEAKHQLNQLHDHVSDLAKEVNATDQMVTVLNAQVKSKLKEHDEVVEKCEEEAAKIEKKQKENLEMLKTLRNEMEEMKQIANPDVGMNMKNNTLIGSLAQMGLGELLKNPDLPQASSLMQIRAEEVMSTREEPEEADAQSLLQPLKMAMLEVTHCMGAPKHKLHRHLVALQKRQDGEEDEAEDEEADPNTTTRAPVDMNALKKNVACESNMTVKIKFGDKATDVSPSRDMEDGDKVSVPCATVDPNLVGVIWLTCNGGDIDSDANCVDSSSNATKCDEEKEKLVETFVKVYVDLAREIQAKETETTEGYEAEKEALKTKCDDQKKPLEKDAAKIAEEASEKIKELEKLRPRLEDAKDSTTKLEEQVKKLTDESALIPKALTDLQKVRETIKALSLCPGLTRGILMVPTFIDYIEFTEDATKTSDADIDKKMKAACQSAFKRDGEVLPATVAELAQNSIHRMPLTNTADKPLIGMCPQCEGDTDTAGGATHKDGHARICWDAGANLSLATQRKDCATPPFKVACVVISNPGKNNTSR